MIWMTLAQSEISFSLLDRIDGCVWLDSALCLLVDNGDVLEIFL